MRQNALALNLSPLMSVHTTATKITGGLNWKDDSRKDFQVDCCGSEMINVEPALFDRFRAMLPPCSSATHFAIESPRPAPLPFRDSSRDRALSTRKKRSNTCGWAAAGIPGPVSLITISE